MIEEIEGALWLIYGHLSRGPISNNFATPTDNRGRYGFRLKRKRRKKRMKQI
jgi:hypothetical protein